MLDEYVDSLPENAQVALAARLIDIALPAWERHLADHPGDLEKVNALITERHRVAGALPRLAADLPRAALRELRKSIEAGKDLKRSSSLRRCFATIMQPLTNPAWDDALPPPAWLAYTATWNLLTSLLFTRRTMDGDTHIYVAVNQACDAILQGQLMTRDDLERVLDEYRGYQGAPVVTTARGSGEAKQSGPFPSVRQMFASIYKDEIDPSCPVCGSSEVTGSAVGIEFTGMRCAACGNDDTCDVWQLDEWYA